MSPTLKTSEGGRIGENGDERAGSAASGRTGAGSCQRVDARGSGRADGAELPANQAAVEAVPETRGGGTGARERGAEIEPGQAAEVAGQGAGADPGAVLRRTRREIRADAGRGASGQRKGNRDWGGHPAAGMLAAGLWSRERKVRAHRSRRARREHFGELLQMDGSFHQWLEERGPRGCLMNLVDDATGTTLCRLGEQETIWAAVGVLTAWIEKYGVPRALYTDWKNVYVREPTSQELLQGKPAVTQFGRMCERLGIQIIAARSPQAKGRVEWNHGTHQDRLVKKLRRKKISTHAEVNRYLEEEYCDEHNRRFAVEARAQKWIIICRRPKARSCERFSGWRRSGCWATIGWCATTTGSIRWSGRAGITHRPRARW